ncbi:hypothetical protein, partial [Pantoea dispersa]|uniref:hypothetical protein n=1 Tax=Pantoea dispersa TaxID=59814 RepID=UPI001C045BCB
LSNKGFNSNTLLSSPEKRQMPHSECAVRGNSEAKYIVVIAYGWKSVEMSITAISLKRPV